MPDVSLATLALRLAVSMGVVLALMLVAAKLLRRAQAYAAGSAAAPRGRRPARVTRIPIAVSSVTALNRNASVAIVRAGGRELVVGITEHQVTLLHSALDPEDATAPTGGTDDVDRHDAGDGTLTSLDSGSPDLGTDPLAGLIDLDSLTGPSQATPTGAARIAALVPTSPRHTGTDGGSSAWTDTLETLRARTVRR